MGPHKCKTVTSADTYNMGGITKIDINDINNISSTAYENPSPSFFLSISDLTVNSTNELWVGLTIYGLYQYKVDFLLDGI